MNLARRATTLLVIGGLLIGGVSAAQPFPRGDGVPTLHGRAGGVALAGLGALPIGTAIELRFHDADPAAGGAPVTTLRLTVGVDSEAAFAAAFAAARDEAAAWDAAFLVVATGPQTRTVTKDEAATLPTAMRWPLAMGLTTEDDTVTVDLYDGDPAAGGVLLETLSFTHGVDSAIGFRAALQEGWARADVAIVTFGPREVTRDLQASPQVATDLRLRMADRMQGARGMGVAPGMMDRVRGQLGDRFGARSHGDLRARPMGTPWRAR